MSVRSFVRKHVLPRLPDALAQPIRRAHYARLLRAESDDRIPEARIFRELIRPGDSVIDIGAAIGSFSRILSAIVGPDGRVYGIEAMPSMFDVFRSNVRKLGMHNVEPIHRAVSDRDETVTMEIPASGKLKENPFRARISETESPDGVRRVQVGAATLDTLFGDRAAGITFIKCDVEGREQRVLRGAHRLIENARPAWFVEVSGDPDEPESKGWHTVRAFEAFGYETWWYVGPALKKRELGDESTDYFFLSPEHVAALGRKNMLV